MARFDEDSNIRWARTLEDAGVQVFHGIVGKKTHAKLALLVRRDPDGVTRRYAHLGTGNYNSVTARFYTDISLLTSGPRHHRRRPARLQLPDRTGGAGRLRSRCSSRPSPSRPASSPSSPAKPSMPAPAAPPTSSPR